MINEAWGRPGGRNERTLGYFDEDSITMGISAVHSCLDDQEIAEVDGLFFSSTTSPFKEKLASTTMAMILNLPPETRTVDIGNSLRSGTSAVISALDSLGYGSRKRALVVASETGRLEVPGGMNEGLWGDGACAVVMGGDGVLLNILRSFSYSDELAHFWRREKDRYVQSEDVRFPQVMGYARIMEAAIEAFLKKSGYQAKDFAKVVIDAPDGRSHQGLMRRFGFDPKTQVQDLIHATLGSLGTAHPFVMLSAALETLKPKDKILWGTYGDGTDLLVLEATDKIEAYPKRSLLKSMASRKEMISSYTKYLNFKKLFDAEEPGYYSSVSGLLRERDRFSRFIGGRCKVCGYITTLSLMVCPECRKKDQFENVKLSQKGRVFTFTQEWYYPCPEPPTTLAVVDLESGGRIYCQMTDCSNPSLVKVGMPVEMTLRKYHEAINLPHYYWKCKPV
jgi:3-hydroxy-3-methylglutaryl CoA synthase